MSRPVIPAPEEPGRGAGRRRRRAGPAALAVGLILLAGCGPRGLSDGVWLSSDGEESYVLSFDDTEGLVAGTMHHLVQGRQWRQWSFAGTRNAAGELELTWGGNNSLTARVDLELNEIEVTARLRDSPEFEALLLRRDPREIPGLLAQRELPYNLRPPAPDSGWEVAEPAAVGLDPAALEATVRAVTRGEAGLLHSLLIVRRGKLVLEEYFHGWTRDDLHELQSVTKSVASLLVGVAHDRGAIADLETPVLDWLPEHAATATAGWEKVRLEHLLTMTAGLDWEPRETRRPRPPGPELFARVLGRRVAHEPGSRWLYNGHDLQLLGAVLHRATGLHADELAAEALFAPLGITAWDWEIAKTEGYCDLAGSLQLRPLDMARIGQMVLDRGRWQGRQVVSEEWIARSTTPRVASQGAESEDFAYLWSQSRAPFEGGSVTVTNASGWGSQFIHVAPELEAVVVATGGNHFTGKTFALGGVLTRELVPGVTR